MLRKTEQFKRRSRRVGAGLAAGWITITALIWVPLPVSAGAMDSMLDGMFVGVTKPDVYNSQTRLGLVGGDFTMRVPTRPINIVSFDPPRMNAGCGGIDLHGGSFSFINTQELVAVFRGIAQGAVAALFKMAITSISGTLGTTMTEFANKLQELNQMFKNSCRIGESLVNGQFSKDANDVVSKAGEVSDSFKAMVGSVGDIMKGALDGFKSSTFGNVAPISDNGKAGNLAWRAMMANEVYKGVGFQNGPVEESFVAIMIMSIGGSQSVKIEGDVAQGDCGGSLKWGFFGTDSKTCLSPLGIWPGNEWSVNDLVDPPENLTLTGCNNANLTEWGCGRASPVTMRSKFKGTRAWVNKALFGREDGADGVAESSDITGGLVGEILSGKNPSTQTITLLNGIHTPILSYLRAVQRSPGALVSVARTLAEPIAQEMALAMAQAYLNAARKTFAGDIHIEKPADWDKNLDLFGQALATKQGDVSVSLDLVVKTNAYVTAVVQSLPGIAPELSSSRK